MGKRVRGGTIRFLIDHMQGFNDAVLLVGFISLMLIIPKVASPIITQILVDNILPGLNPEWGGPLVMFAIVITLMEIILRLMHTTSWRYRLSMSLSSASELFWHALRLPVDYYHDK